MSKINNYRSAFIYMILLFFMWGFLTELNNTLIPFCRGLFELNYFQSSLVSSAFFIAFFVMSLPAAKWIEYLGYRAGIVAGLLLMAIGCWLFIPASNMEVFYIFLGAIFVLATGVTFLQVAANPYVSRLGEPEGASSRLNLSQGFNSLAKIIAPIFGSYLILATVRGLPPEEQAQAVQMPYLGLGLALAALAILFYFIKLPKIIKTSDDSDVLAHSSGKTSIFQFPQLRWGALAIFFYVGAEVTIASFFVLFISEYIFPALADYQQLVADLSDEEKLMKFREIAERRLPWFWSLMMIGRLGGAYILKFIPAPRLLAIAAVACIAMMTLFLFSSGYLALYLLIGTGLFLSIMWSNIFTLSIDGLENFTSQGSGILVMCIVGGAAIPPIQGLIADSSWGLQASFVVTIFCFLYILFYAIKGYKKG